MYRTNRSPGSCRSQDQDGEPGVEALAVPLGRGVPRPRADAHAVVLAEERRDRLGTERGRGRNLRDRAAIGPEEAEAAATAGVLHPEPLLVHEPVMRPAQQ